MIIFEIEYGRENDKFFDAVRIVICFKSLSRFKEEDGFLYRGMFRWILCCYIIFWSRGILLFWLEKKI